MLVCIETIAVRYTHIYRRRIKQRYRDRDKERNKFVYALKTVKSELILMVSAVCLIFERITKN